MTQTRLKARSGAIIDSEAIEAFAAEIAGNVIKPGDAEYKSARRIWNGIIDKHPGLIVRCVGTADVQRAVRFARENDILVAVRGGGHNVAGRALCDDGIVIDLSLMRGVFVDPDAKTVRVQGGAMLGDVDRETALHGLAVPAGVVSKTGIAGLTLGGGVGWLVRKYGPTCDNVLEFSLVDANGDLLTVNASQNPDLFWALRGGGGNFGVVTSFLYKAYPVSTVLGGLIIHPREAAASLLRHYRDFMTGAPEELTVYTAMLSTPDGIPAIGVVPCYCGPIKEGEKLVAPLRNFGNPMMDAVQPMPFTEMQKLLDGAFPDGTRNYWKSTFIKELSDEVIDLLVEHANRMNSPLSSMVIEFYGGVSGRVDPTENAFAQRQSEYDIGFMAQWQNPADDEANIKWARDASDAIQPYSSGVYLLNFLSDENQDLVRAAFGDNYERLAKLKGKYDPENFFSLNQNIKPAA
jgi:FAD/FMN-containing dehydrogenase